LPRKLQAEERIAKIRRFMSEMQTARIELFASNAPKYAEALGAFRSALRKSGFSDEESTQIVLKAMERRGRRPMWARDKERRLR
jgi:hypothetical protein